MYVLGINSVYHESAACLLRDGEIVFAVEEERLNRIKRGKVASIEAANQLPFKAIDWCLKSQGIRMSDVSGIGYSFDPSARWKKHQIGDDFVTINSWGTPQGERLFYEKNLSVVGLMEAHYSADLRSKWHFVPHHMSHLASAYYPSGFDRAALLSMDGIGEFESTCMAIGDNLKIDVLDKLNYPNSIGFVWEKLSKFLGFGEYDACKVMGLSSFGNARRFKDLLSEIISYDSSGRFEVNNDVFRFRLECYEALEAHFRLRKRDRGYPIDDVHRDLAAGLQSITEEIIVKVCKDLRRKSSLDRLCLAGGVALNCVANGRIASEVGFKDIWVQPAANDAGTSIGAAYYVWHELLGQETRVKTSHTYLGPEFGHESIEKELIRQKVSYRRSVAVERDTAELIAEGNIVSWFQGRMEFGPRALGNRSLLADPRDESMKTTLNLRVKHREDFRPFCPSVTEEKCDLYFETRDIAASQFMLAAFNVISTEIPAVTHVDSTARVQQVSQETNPRFHKLLTEFDAITGVPVLLNTSFNDQEPIVCSPLDAIRTFLKTDIDYLVMGDFVIAKKDQQSW